MPVIQPRTTETEKAVFADVRLMLAEIEGISRRWCKAILAFTPVGGPPGAQLRSAVGILLANIETSVVGNTFPDKQLAVFDAAYDAGITVAALEPVLAQLRIERPTTNGSTWTTQAAIFHTLATECRVIVGIEFISREDVEVVQNAMKFNFDQAKEWASTEMDNIVYGQLVDLAAKLTRYLADNALPLPTHVYYELRPYPALAAANRIYADASRTEELIQDNKVIHPVFMPTRIRAFSA